MLKVLIADSDPNYASGLQTHLATMSNIEPVGIATYGETVVSLIKDKEPDLVILDPLMKNIDGLNILKEIHNDESVKKKPVYVLDSYQDISHIISEYRQYRVAYFMIKPQLVANICETAVDVYHSFIKYEQRKLLEASSESNSLLLDEIIDNVLFDLGIRPNLSGYRYLVETIKFVIDNSSTRLFITKDIYPMIASKYKTAPNRVERGIRHAIHTGFDRADCEVLEKIFGYLISKDKSVPTNSEFIAVVVKEVKSRMYNYKEGSY